MLEQASRLGAVARWLTDWRFVVGVSVGAVMATLGGQILRVDPPPAPVVEVFPPSLGPIVTAIHRPERRPFMRGFPQSMIEPVPSHLVKLRPGQRRVWRERFVPPYLLRRLTPEEEVRSALLRRTYTGQE
jgi:hypothetical protein